MGKVYKKNTNKYRGVVRYKNGWVATLIHKGETHRSKCFKIRKKAAKSYDRFAKKYHKDNAILNFIEIKTQKSDKHIHNFKKMKRKVFSVVTRNKVCSNQRWCCNICKHLLGSIFIVDHIIPLFLGGTNEEYNLQSLCPECDKYKTAIIDHKILAPLAKERLLKVDDVFQAQNNNIWRLKCVDPKLVMKNRDLITSLNTSPKSSDNETKTIVIKVLKLLLD